MDVGYIKLGERVTNASTIPLTEYVQRFLSGPRDRILLTDHTGSYACEEVAGIVDDYVQQFSNAWEKQTVGSRGVAICLERGVHYIAAIFASWLSDGYYLPLNADSPETVRQKQIELSGVSISLNSSSENGRPILRRENELTSKASDLGLTNARNKQLAYIVFTSGSTGEKKGVAISKQSLSAYMDAVRKQFTNHFKAQSVAINGELTFDISVADIVFALIFKTEICISSEAKNLLSLCSLISKRQIESIYAVPSTWTMILDLTERLPDFSLTHVRNIFSGGEALSEQLLAKMNTFCPTATIFNMYGPTEFTVNCFSYQVGPDFISNASGTVPLGRPLPGVRYHILPSGTEAGEGELLLSGEQLMDGYVNAADPYIEIDGTTYYQTGDLVHEDSEGLVHFVGRLRDYQKISGYRINISSLEAIIGQELDQPIKLVVIDGQIICIVVCSEHSESELIKAEVEKISRQNLEPFERPRVILMVDQLPINSSGKIDRGRIAELVAR